MLRFTAKVLFLLISLWQAGHFSKIWAIRSDLGFSIHIGPHLNYGQGFVSLNNPYGIWEKNRKAPDIKNKNFTEPVGIATELNLRYTLLDRYYISLGGLYCAGVRNIGQYPLASPFTGELLEGNGGNFVGSGQGQFIPIRGSFQQSHYGVPISLGFLINFWQEIRVLMGYGIGLYWANLKTQEVSLDPTIVEYSLQSSFTGFAFTTYLNLVVEYLAVGSPEDPKRLGILVGLQHNWGGSAYLKDRISSDNIPAGTPASPPAVQEDSARINLSGTRIFFGITYYFLATK